MPLTVHGVQNTQNIYYLGLNLNNVCAVGSLRIVYTLPTAVEISRLVLMSYRRLSSRLDL